MNMSTQSTAVPSINITLPRLLVSVRNADEAKIAIDSGVKLLDVKEPAAGSLGAASLESIGEIADLCPQSVLLSVALGELLDMQQQQLPSGVVPAFAKCGLSGCRNHPRWTALWEQQMRNLATFPVAVVYADYMRAESPEPKTIVRHAAGNGCQTVLLDTFDKTGGNLFAHMTHEAIGSWREGVQAAGMKAVVAGSLDGSMIAPLLEDGVDCVAVRGAACRGGRSGRLDHNKLTQLVRTATAVGSPA